MTEAFSPNTALGIVAGLLIKYMWDRFMGTDQKSVPVLIAEIHTKLGSIDTSVQLMRKDFDHSGRDHEELKDDFWQHMEKYHSVTNVPRAAGPVTRPGDSGIRRTN